MKNLIVVFLLLLLLQLSAAAQHIILPVTSSIPSSEAKEKQGLIATHLSAAAAEASGNESPPSNDNSQTAKPGNSVNPAKQFFRDLIDDQKEIWTSPFRIKSGDNRWLIPFAAVTATLIASDRRASRKLTRGEDPLEASSAISRAGSGYATFGAAAAFYAVGKFTHNERAKETGRLGFKALINSSVVVTVLKAATGRQRPNTASGDGRFFSRGNSFPSGHSISIWSLASVVAEEYRDKPLVRVISYGVATATSLSRFTGRNHFPSDVLVGSTLGYLIGRYTVKRYGTPQGNQKIVILPYFGQAKKTFGITTSLSF